MLRLRLGRLNRPELRLVGVLNLSTPLDGISAKFSLLGDFTINEKGVSLSWAEVKGSFVTSFD